MLLKLRAKVVKGAGLGRRLGIPTANLSVSSAKRLPRGVFKVAVNSRIFGRRRIAVCNIGIRPTVGASKLRQVEVHIPGFHGDLYGKILSVSFLKKIRVEKRFASLDALRRQIRRDIRRAVEAES